MEGYGQVVTPMQVAPARGGLEDLLQFIMQRETMDQNTQKFDVGEATRQFINQQNGTQGIDPFALQNYNIAGDTNQRAWNADSRAGAQESRQATDWQQVQDYTKSFIGDLQATDPSGFTGPVTDQHPAYGVQDRLLHAAMAGGANPNAVDAVSKILMGDRNNASQATLQEKLQQIQTQGAINRNNANNAAALQRQQDAFDFNEKHKKGQENSLGSAHYWATGDPSKLSVDEIYKLGGLDTVRAIGAEIKNQIKQQLEQEKDLAGKRIQKGQGSSKDEKYFTEEQLRKLKGGGGGGEQVDPQLSPEQMLEVARARAKFWYGNATPKDAAQKAVKNSKGWGGGGSEAVKAVYPEQYDIAWRNHLKQEQNKKFQLEKEKATNPFLYYINRMLEGFENYAP